MIKMGGKIGALNTVSLIFLTAIIGVYFAKQQGLKTIRSGVLNLYQNKIPIFDMEETIRLCDSNINIL